LTFYFALLTDLGCSSGVERADGKFDNFAAMQREKGMAREQVKFLLSPQPGTDNGRLQHGHNG